jgi:hypothetical protein
MKYLLSILLWAICFWAHAQNEFAPIGAEWYYNKQHNYNPPEAGYIKITSIKDSIINTKKVRVLELIYAPDDTTQIVEGYEYIHQSGDTIWYWKNEQFHLLYNFAMQKGDSILLYSEMENNCGENPYGWNNVDSTFTRTINDIELKAYYLKPLEGSQWEFSNYIFEIIGSLDYFFPQNSFCGIYDIITIGPLRCYSDPVHGILITSQPDMKCDSTYTYTDPVNAAFFIKRTSSFSLYPNPAFNKLSIKGFDFNIPNGNVEIKIINTKGHVIKKYETDMETIDVTGLVRGTYFLIITINEKIIDYERFIKI